MRQLYLPECPSKTGLKSFQAVRMPAERLTHEYTPSGTVERAVTILTPLLEESKARFSKEQGTPFDRYNIEHGKVMKPMMWKDPRMIRALRILGLPIKEVERIYLPWWIESAGNHIETRIANGNAHVVLGARHSYHSQMARSSIEIPWISSVSVAGFVHTADDYLVVGLRGGANLPNTYYFSAGALGMLPEVQAGNMSIYQFYVREELRKEYGMRSKDITRAELMGIVSLEGADRDVSYVFVVHTPLRLREVFERQRSNQDEDRKEHDRLFGIRPADVTGFVRQFYRGLAKNDYEREMGQRVLLTQGAAPLLSYVNENLSLLDELASRYVQPV